MSTDQQGVPRPVETCAWMCNSLLDNHDTQHADNNNSLLSIPFSDSEPGLEDISSSLLAESILPNPLVCNEASCIHVHSFNYVFTIIISIQFYADHVYLLVCNNVYMKWECVIALYENTFI